MSPLDKLDSDSKFFSRVCFGDESTFDVCDMLNRHNSRTWGLENLYDIRKLKRDIPKVNVQCGFIHDKIIELFFFAEKSIAIHNCLDVLTEYAALQLNEHQPSVVLPQKGAPGHWSFEVLQYLNETFPDLWIGGGNPISLPTPSPDITAIDFLWGRVKEMVYQSKIRHIFDLQRQITEQLQ